MIYTYGITQLGTYHVKHDMVCQDAHNIIKCDESCAVSAVADGLGSEEHSDIASEMAAKISTVYCAENIKDDCSDEQILNIIRDSFVLAQSRIEKVATDNGHDWINTIQHSPWQCLEEMLFIMASRGTVEL